MRTLAWLVVMVVALTSFQVRAAEPVPSSGRGAVSVLGLVFGALGVGGVGLGLGALLSQGEVDVVTNPYLPVGRDDSSVVRLLIDRHDQATRTAIIGFVSGGALLLASLVCLLADTPRGPVVSVVPTRDGAMVSLALRFQ